MTLPFVVALVAALHAPTPEVRAQALRPLYLRAAASHGISARLLERVVAHESRHRVWAVGDHGHAFGLGQVHREALPWRRYTRAELLRPDVNVDAAAAHLARDLKLCHGRVAYAVARYQRGNGCAASEYSRSVLATPKEKLPNAEARGDSGAKCRLAVDRREGESTDANLGTRGPVLGPAVSTRPWLGSPGGIGGSPAPVSASPGKSTCSRAQAVLLADVGR